mmetsp:Transcript_17661/g.25791  ORF Transcript_17661/g.25791 Transcript_17661/m.25791 type:complete len:256 (+) Transcript_17661:71-838(+)
MPETLAPRSVLMQKRSSVVLRKNQLAAQHVQEKLEEAETSSSTTTHSCSDRSEDQNISSRPGMKRCVSWRDEDNGTSLTTEHQWDMLSEVDHTEVDTADLNSVNLSVNEKDEISHPVHEACRKGSLAEVRQSLDKQELSHIDELDENGWTCLMTASSYGQLNIVELLLQRGADIDFQDELGQTALFCACYDGRPNVVRHLLRMGANRMLLDNDSIMPGQLYSSEVSEQVQKQIIHLIRFTIPSRRSSKAPCCAVS